MRNAEPNGKTTQATADQYAFPQKIAKGAKNCMMIDRSALIA